MNENVCTRMSDNTAICCLAEREHNLTECHPQIGISSCDELISDHVLRVSIWIVGASCLLCNAFVVIWRIKEHKVH